MSKTAIITGIGGQDGAYLAELLLKKGYRVIGTDRRRVDQHYWRLHKLGIANDIEVDFMDLLEIGNIFRIVAKYKPDEIYNLAAQSFVGASFKMPLLTADVDAMGVLRLLEAVRTMSPNTKFYQASTSEMFGDVLETPQKETTPFNPRSPYGVAKLFAHEMVKNYRESYDMYCCSGILFNHESPLRGLEFVTRKITHAIANIKHGQQERLTLGNLSAKRDWGFAKDYVEGMWRMLQQDTPDDYILSMEETHSVRSFVEIAFAMAGYEIVWKGEGVEEKGYDAKTGQCLVEVSEKFFRPAEVDLLLGDCTKAKTKLGWQPKLSFKELVELMVSNDLEMVKGKILNNIS